MFEQIAELKRQGKRIGFTASAFDLLHAGHVAMLEEAKSQCDFLIVGLLTDPTRDRPDKKNKPIQTTYERWIQAQAIKVIDMVIPFDTEEDLETMIKMIKPHVRIVGEEYKGTHHTGWDIKDVEIYYNKRNHNYGSSQLRNKIIDQETEKNKNNE
jgi:glycerol-3-phosphate cytidylyltransferase